MAKRTLLEAALELGQAAGPLAHTGDGHHDPAITVREISVADGEATSVLLEAAESCWSIDDARTGEQLDTAVIEVTDLKSFDAAVKKARA